MGLSNKSAFYDFTPVRISTDRGDFHFRGPIRLPHFSKREKSGEALNAGISWAGTVIVVFFEMLRAVFSLRCLMRKVPNPRRKTFSLRIWAARTCSINSSTTVETVTASTPVVRAICFTISCFVIVLVLTCISNLQIGCLNPSVHEVYV